MFLMDFFQDPNLCSLFSFHQRSFQNCLPLQSDPDNWPTTLSPLKLTISQSCSNCGITSNKSKLTREEAASRIDSTGSSLESWIETKNFCEMIPDYFDFHSKDMS